VFLASSVFAPSGIAHAVNWLANNDIAAKLREPLEPEELKDDELVEMAVERIGISKDGYQPVAILKEIGGELRLPIWIGLLEANAISVVLEGVQLPRPLTSDLLRSVIDKMGASVNYIVVNDLKENTFYANIILKANWLQMTIDSRPSDAIAIALRTEAPIYATKAVIEKAGLPGNQEEEKYIMRVGKNQSLNALRYAKLAGPMKDG